MTSCTIIISHYESLQFLHTSIRQIRKYKHPDIEQTILIADQSGEETALKIHNEYSGSKDVIITFTAPKWSGYGIDCIMQNDLVKTEYICQIHADVLPIHKNWLYLPIKLIEEYGLSFVGQLQFISKTGDSIYPPSPFFAMAQCFNVARTETYREMSLQAGFTRFDNREGMEFLNNDWAEWAQTAPNKGCSDDDVPAFHWEDKYRTHDKLGLAVTGYIGPQYARIIEDIVFHFGSANEARGVMDRMPDDYQRYTEMINQNYSDELVDGMVTLAKISKPPELEILQRNFWDGAKKQSLSCPETINQRIECLKQ